MDVKEEIQAHILSVWKEKRGFFSGKGSEGMLILTNSRVLFLDVIEDGKEQKYQFSIVQDWVKYPLSAPTKFLKVDWSGFVKYVKNKQIVTN